MNIAICDTENNAPQTEQERALNPNSPIIEIGACIVDLRAGKIVAKFSELVNLPHVQETVYPFIEELTGISQEMIDKDGRHLYEVLKDFWAWMEKYNCRLLCGWGPDATEIVAESKEMDLYPPKKFRTLDIKTMFMVLNCGLPNRKLKNGLKGTMEMLGIPFQGKQHRGLIDSENTARLLMYTKELVFAHDKMKNHKMRDLDI